MKTPFNRNPMLMAGCLLNALALSLGHFAPQALFIRGALLGLALTFMVIGILEARGSVRLAKFRAFKRSLFLR